MACRRALVWFTRRGLCARTFTATKEAATLSRAAHFSGCCGSGHGSVFRGLPGSGHSGEFGRCWSARHGNPVHAQRRGETDIVAMSHNGFVVSSGEEFLTLQKSIVATDPAKPHPWPVEQFLSTHPLALKFVVENKVVPASFANEAFFSNNSFVFIDKGGKEQTIRYKILPVAGQRDLSDAEAQAKGVNFLVDDLKTRLAAAPIQYKLMAQLPNPGDVTKDPSLVWPEDRKLMELGTISITAVVADSDKAQKELAFDPAKLIDGIGQSDDELPALRSQVYAMSVTRRQK